MDGTLAALKIGARSRSDFFAAIVARASMGRRTRGARLTVARNFDQLLQRNIALKHSHRRPHDVRTGRMRLDRKKLEARPMMRRILAPLAALTLLPIRFPRPGSLG
jgi:hypothetical protein